MQWHCPLLVLCLTAVSPVCYVNMHATTLLGTFQSSQLLFPYNSSALCYQWFLSSLMYCCFPGSCFRGDLSSRGGVLMWNAMAEYAWQAQTHRSLGELRAYAHVCEYEATCVEEAGPNSIIPLYSCLWMTREICLENEWTVGGYGAIRNHCDTVVSVFFWSEVAIFYIRIITSYCVPLTGDRVF